MKDTDRNKPAVNDVTHADENIPSAYEKPQVLFRQRLEAVAAACDPGAGGKEVVPDSCTLFAGS